MRSLDDSLAVEIDRLIHISASCPIAPNIDLESDTSTRQIIAIQGLRDLNPSPQPDFLAWRRCKREVHRFPVAGTESGTLAVRNGAFMILPVPRSDGTESA